MTPTKHVHGPSVVIVALCLFLSSCAATPAEKVKQTEDRNTALKESSGYNECMRKVTADEQKIKDCETAKLIAAGFTDGLECVGTGNEDPRCQDKTRYNTEVYAHNDCPNEVTFETELSEGDCAQMLMDVLAQ